MLLDQQLNNHSFTHLTKKKNKKYNSNTTDRSNVYKFAVVALVNCASTQTNERKETRRKVEKQRGTGRGTRRASIHPEKMAI
jgi:hypothetical protein